MIANPLQATNNTIGALLTAPPDFTTLYKWNTLSNGFEIATYFLGLWDHPEYTLNPGEGAIVQSTSPWTNTYVGEVQQGNLTNSYPSGFSIRASRVPQAGTLTQLGLPGSQLTDFDTIYIYNTTNQGYDIYTWFLGAWSGPTPEPSLKVGESMWLQVANPGNWVRNFTVQ
jgi:hypothetical protein